MIHVRNTIVATFSAKVQFFLLQRHRFAVGDDVFHVHCFILCLEHRIVASSRYVFKNNCRNLIGRVSLHYTKVFTLDVDVRKANISDCSIGLLVAACHIKELFPWKHFNDRSATACNIFDRYIFIKLVGVGPHFQSKYGRMVVHLAITDGDVVGVNAFAAQGECAM